MVFCTGIFHKGPSEYDFHKSGHQRCDFFKGTNQWILSKKMGNFENGEWRGLEGSSPFSGWQNLHHIDDTLR